MSSHIVFTRDAQTGVATLQIDRPDKKNALTFAMYAALTEALATAEADQGVRAIVVRGGDSCFSAGNDIGDFMQIAAGGGDISAVARFLGALTTLKKPIVAGAAGLAIGIGTTMLLHCDLVYAAPNLRLKTPFVDLGLVPEAASSLLLPALMGHRQAAAMLMLGEELGAEAARVAGIVNAVVDDPAAAARAAAVKLAEKPAAALVTTKSLMKRAQAAAVEETMKIEGVAFAERLRSPEAMQAFMAFASGGKR